ncbi:uncharacterized protein LOC123875908 [Maniola jurtina]|uniref:uncharacterized protein LOC123875908 n=1 Tax=Maniola jurtina TaxID=191418 RepID=UPI001E687F67|nr:uncharacterized protein LOC123875908 [Maniola jurtina]
MDIQSGKNTQKRSSLHSFAIENYNGGDYLSSRTFGEEGEYSGGLKNQARDSVDVDDIVKKYKDAKLKTKGEYSNQNLMKKMDEYDLLNENTGFTQSSHNFYNYVEPKYCTASLNRNNHVSVISSNETKPYLVLNENIGHKVTFEEQNNSNLTKVYEQTGLTSREKFCSDKTTYCRPVASLYNEEFMHKTMERNSRLKRLVKQLAIARQREREYVNWNNFINDLKNKHGAGCNESQWTHQPHEPEKYITPDIIDDHYNTRFSCRQSRPYSNLLEDFYEGYYVPPQPTYYTNRPLHKSKPQSYSNHYSSPYSTNSYCYPTASQGRLIMLERERQRNEYLNQWNNRLSNNYFRHENNLINKNYYERHLAEKQNLNNSFTPNNNKNIVKTCIQSATVQTDNYLSENIFRNKATNKTVNPVIDAFIQTFETDKRIDEKCQDTENNMKTLVNIENKLDSLIVCINNLIDEIQLNRKSKRKTKAVTSEINNITNKKTNMDKINTMGKVESARTDKLFSGEIINDSSENSVETSNFYPCTAPKASEIDEILKEIDKFCSKDRLFKSQPCSVNITFEVPTKDCSTEVTKSLSKHQTGENVEIIEEICTPEHMPMQKMTIAVNTDPFNFLSLLRISTEALMRLLSNVQNITYHSYLALLPLPQTTARKVESHFTCNICGTAFNKPSALSDHIQEHNLGKTRDCYICRHVLDVSGKVPKLFKCQFCAQRFTRAYCCDLHQRGCAQRSGQIHDVASSLMLLR